ncbi:MAG: adenylosuccinate lyase [Steroidobacteraceae bacterium]
MTIPGPSDAALQSISPLDGRYAASVSGLRPLVCEAALITRRIQVEARWLRFLLRELRAAGAVELPAAVAAELERLDREPPADAPLRVKRLEQRTNHDVKAVEYYIREQLQSVGASNALLELVHFGCTSEDINNVSYALLLDDARELLAVQISRIGKLLKQMAGEYADTAMLARTHGQAASPTTFGKEMANIAARLDWTLLRWQGVTARGKWNGAVGNFNAHIVARPDIDWPNVSARFVAELGLEPNMLTTQIEPHDWIGAYCDALCGINIVLLDFARDMWGYISLGYLHQRAIDGEVGSSTMPHKVNPIDFENAEGNIGVANALLRHFADKLPVSRWQRDLTDSTVLRNIGVALGHSLVAQQALLRGLGKVSVNRARMTAELTVTIEVLGEAVQMVLRAEGIADGYELLKKFTRGRPISIEQLHEFVGSLPLSADARERLLALQPEGYTGLARQLALSCGSSQQA